MILGIATYTYIEHTAPEGAVRNFLNSDFVRMYCAGNLDPLIINPISAEILEDIFEDDVDDGLASDDERQAILEWFRNMVPDNNTIIAIVEG
jgi:hypothetical protein